MSERTLKGETVSRIVVEPAFIGVPPRHRELLGRYEAFGEQVDGLLRQVMAMANDVVQVTDLRIDSPEALPELPCIGQRLSAERACAFIIEECVVGGGVWLSLAGDGFTVECCQDGAVAVEIPDDWLDRLSLTDEPDACFRVVKPEPTTYQRETLQRVADSQYWNLAPGASQLLVVEKFARGDFGLRWWTCGDQAAVKAVREVVMPGSIVSVMPLDGLARLSECDEGTFSQIVLAVSRPRLGGSVHLLETLLISTQERDALVSRGYGLAMTDQDFWENAAVVPGNDGAVRAHWPVHEF